MVSGSGIGLILVCRLMDGDPGGHVRRALSHFPYQDVAQRVLDSYYLPDGRAPGQPYKRHTMWSINPPKELNQLTVIANFVEVFLAKEGHGNPVGINLLEKLQVTLPSSLYGAMLAGVDYVIIGAGIPIQVPGVLDKLAEHAPVSYRVDVLDADPDDDYRVHFDPEATFPGIAAKVGPLKRPNFLPIISSNVLAQALATRSTGKINGFVIEMPTAGGHNAPPRGALQLDEKGQPVYGPKDEINLDRIKKLGLPFWLAGGYGNPEKFQEALALGAAGIQVGTAFAYTEEAGFAEPFRKTVLQMVRDETAVVHTDPVISPTGFPFKVVQASGTASEETVYEGRSRVCDVGFLRHLYKLPDGKLGYRCPAEPVKDYVRKGGDIADTVGRGCLCNNLGAAAGYGQIKKDGSVEPPIITSGDDLVSIGCLLPTDSLNYRAKDVIDFLTQNGHDSHAVAPQREGQKTRA